MASIEKRLCRTNEDTMRAQADATDLEPYDHG